MTVGRLIVKKKKAIKEYCSEHAFTQIQFSVSFVLLGVGVGAGFFFGGGGGGGRG